MESGLPEYMCKYVTNVHDVRGDGHCGFRAVALQLKGDQEGWKDVREKLTDELLHSKRHDLYYRHVYAMKTSD